MITIRNVKQFSAFVGAVIKVATACKFVIDENGCSVAITTGDNNVFRAKFEITSVTSTEPVTFCVGNLQILYKSIDVMVKSNKNITSMELEYDKAVGALKFNNGANTFKLTTVKEVIVEKYIAQPLLDLKPDFGLKTTSKAIKHVCDLQSLSDDSAHVYMTHVGGTIKAEIDNKELKSINSISVPLATGEAIIGNWTRQWKISVPICLLFASLESDDITIRLCDKPLLQVIALSGDVKMTINATLVKGK